MQKNLSALSIGEQPRASSGQFTQRGSKTTFTVAGKRIGFLKVGAGRGAGSKTTFVVAGRRKITSSRAPSARLKMALAVDRAIFELTGLMTERLI